MSPERAEQIAPAQPGNAASASVPAVSPQADPLPESLARWTGNLLYWVTSMGAQYYAQATAALGVTPPQIAILQLLAAEGVLRQARLAERTRIDKATMVGLLNDLEHQGLLERRVAPNDKRAFDIALTAQGHASVQQIEAVSQAADAEFFGLLSPQEHETLRALLLRLITRSAS